MKIYFAGSISGGRDDVKIYSEIINYLKKYGEVLTEHVGDAHLSAEDGEGIGDKKIHDRDMKWVLSSDILVAEITKPSLGVGYEIGRAFENGKKILCLYRKEDGKMVSPMIIGNDKIKSFCYSDLEEAKEVIDGFSSTL
ncbi:MAG: nucleoside 2-deoxyribosyltransferase [Candidatus Pacearchaeota archaeon]|nr:nucleoside 2-deoxyribosyltransferase [Candidatus Pacearchaeota archaeon]